MPLRIGQQTQPDRVWAMEATVTEIPGFTMTVTLCFRDGFAPINWSFVPTGLVASNTTLNFVVPDLIGQIPDQRFGLTINGSNINTCTFLSATGTFASSGPWISSSYNITGILRSK